MATGKPQPESSRFCLNGPFHSNVALMNIKTKIRQSILDSLLKFLVPVPAEGQRAPFGPEEFKLIREALLSQNLCSTDGQMVPAFEKEFASAYDIPYAVGSTSGTAAIHVALGALDLNPCDE